MKNTISTASAYNTVQLHSVETDTALVDHLRKSAKNEDGRLTAFGKAFIAAAREYNVKQAYVARLLKLSAGAVCQNYERAGKSHTSPLDLRAPK